MRRRLWTTRSWVFFTMEGVGDASEDPFERSMNDVPMNALCRTIERDLRQMLGEQRSRSPMSRSRYSSTDRTSGPDHA